MNIIIPALTGNGFSISERTVFVPEYYALYTVKNGIIYFTRFQDNWSRVGETNVHVGSVIHILDPITALIRGLATEEELGLGGGVQALIALIKA